MRDGTDSIKIIGISLRDFLTPQGVLSDVWKEITKHLIENNNITVKVLQLDPGSSEGLFRHDVEKNIGWVGGMRSDIPRGLEEIVIQVLRLKKKFGESSLEYGVYAHCPFSFLFITKKGVFVANYSYRDNRDRPPASPLFLYDSGSPVYMELSDSFDIIWSHSRTNFVAPQDEIEIKIDEFLDHSIADAIAKAHIRGIFRHDKRKQLGSIILKDLEADGDIAIQAMTGRFFFREMLGRTSLSLILLNDRAKRMQDRGLSKKTIKVLLQNPISYAGIIRAFGDSFSNRDISDGIARWNFISHSQSTFYSDVNMAIRVITSINDRAREDDNDMPIILRLANVPLQCSCILTKQCAFVEQYLFGKARDAVNEELRDDLRTLGAEYPVFVFEGTDSFESQLLEKSFDFIWKNFSIGVDVFRQLQHEDEFNANLEYAKKCYCNNDKEKDAKKMGSGLSIKHP